MTKTVRQMVVGKMYRKIPLITKLGVTHASISCVGNSETGQHTITTPAPLPTATPTPEKASKGLHLYYTIWGQGSATLLSSHRPDPSDSNSPMEATREGYRRIKAVFCTSNHSLSTVLFLLFLLFLRLLLLLFQCYHLQQS